MQQRLLNNTLSLQHLEELSSMVLPIQPPAGWDAHPPWTRFLRDDLPRRESYSQVLTMHLQSANSELREIDGLNAVVSQLNWRGDNKIAHLHGATPLLPPEHLVGPAGIQLVKESVKDFSVLPNLPERKVRLLFVTARDSARADDLGTRRRRGRSTRRRQSRLRSTISSVVTRTRSSSASGRFSKQRRRSSSPSPSGTPFCPLTVQRNVAHILPTGSRFLLLTHFLRPRHRSSAR